MGSELVRLLRLWLALLAEQLLLFPVACILYRFSGMEQFGLFTLCYLGIDGLAMLARTLLPKKARPWILIAGMLAGVGLCILFSPNLFFRIIAPVLLALMLWHGVHMTELGHPGNFFSSFLLIGFMLYPLTAWVFSRSPFFEDLLPTLAVTGTVGILLALVLINRQQIRDAGTVLERKLHLPSALMHKNSLYLVVFTLLVLAGASWEVFSRLIMGLYALLGHMVGAIIAFLASMYQREETIPEQGGLEEAAPDMMPPAEPTPRWLEILETILIIVVGVAFLCLLLWGLYRLVKQLLPFLRKAWVFLSEWLRRVFLGDANAAATDPGFVDEVESLLNQNETALSAARRWLMDRMAREPGFGTMKTDSERIRWLYRNLVRREMKRGMVIQPGDTPSEILHAMAQHHNKHPRLDPGAASDLYGLVRYAEKSPDADAVLRMKQACE